MASIELGTLTTRVVAGAANGRLPDGGGVNVGAGVGAEVGAGVVTGTGVGVGTAVGAGAAVTPAVVKTWSVDTRSTPDAVVERTR